MTDKKQQALDDFDKAQELEYKIGRFIIVSALIIEILNVIPGTLMGNLWLCPWAISDIISVILGRLFPILGVVFTICAFKGYTFSRYLLSTIYGINIFRIGLNLPIFLSDFGTIMRSDNTVTKGLMIFFMVTTIICLVYNIIMCISMLISKNVSNYMYTKLYK